MKKNKLKIFYTLLAFQFFAIANVVNAQWSDPADFGLGDNMDTMMMNVTKWLLGLVTTLSVLALIWGGVNYVGSSGDTQKAELSKKIIYFAMIGLTVAGLAYAMVKVLVSKILTGTAI